MIKNIFLKLCFLCSVLLLLMSGCKYVETRPRLPVKVFQHTILIYPVNDSAESFGVQESVILANDEELPGYNLLESNKEITFPSRNITCSRIGALTRECRIEFDIEYTNIEFGDNLRLSGSLMREIELTSMGRTMNGTVRLVAIEVTLKDFPVGAFYELQRTDYTTVKSSGSSLGTISWELNPSAQNTTFVYILPHYHVLYGILKLEFRDSSLAGP